MASKLYPTLSAFYRAEHIGFGSEDDAMLCGVPDEKLYRKPPKQRVELPGKDTQVDGTSTELPPVSGETTTDPESGPETLPLTPTAPPLLEMLDARLQQYLDALLASKTNKDSTANSPQSSFHLSGQSPSPDHVLGSDHHQQQNPDSAVNLPPNVFLEEAWLDELQPDYDDLTPEEMADEILNNLDVVGDANDKDREKSLGLLRFELGLGLHGHQDGKEQLPYPHRHQHYEREHRHRQHYQKQLSLNSSEGNESSGHPYQEQKIAQQQQSQQHHSRPQHQNKSRNIERLQSGDGDHPPAAGKEKRHDTTDHARVSNTQHNILDTDRDRRREAGYPQRRPHAGQLRKPHANSRSDLVGSATDLHICGRREGSRTRRPSTRRCSGTEAEKENVSGSPGKSKLHGDSSDYNAWMTWRKQVNRQLATIILLKQQGRQIEVQNADMRRKPLRQSSIDFVSQIATQTGSSTSLGGKPYVMYGIPRASLLPGNIGVATNKKDS